jgi:hypothetical protein
VNSEGRTPDSAPIELDLPQAAAPRRPAPPVAPPRAAAWQPAPPPPASSWLQDHLKTIVLAVALGGGGLGLYLWQNRPVAIPDLALKDAAGQLTTLSELRQEKPRLLVVFLMKGDTLSAFVLNALKELHPAREARMAFVGLVIGSQAEAEAYRAETNAPFPMYGLKDAQNPFQMRELFKKVGVDTIAYTGVYGGTVVVVDRENKVLLRMEKEGVQDLAGKLAKFR